MKILIFEQRTAGHYMEYFHHLYLGAISHEDNDYVFCVPEDFRQKSVAYDWPEAKNISFHYLSDNELQNPDKQGFLLCGLNNALLLRKKIRETHADKVLLTTLTLYLPFICWFIPSSIKVSGIIYSIYLRSVSEMSGFRLAIERFRYWLAAKTKCIENIFLLNDSESSDTLNKIFDTDKFVCLVDPVPTYNNHALINLRSGLNIPLYNEIYLHFGGLTQRKGTLEILKALCMAEGNALHNKTFIFAGKIYDDIKIEFYKLRELAERKTQVIVFDDFCSYEMLNNLCFTTDYMLIPYQVTNLSSGVLGYASLFDKTVIGPKYGLIGSLIVENQLGITMDDITADGLYKVICDDKPDVHSRKYAEKNTIENFVKTIFDED